MKVLTCVMSVLPMVLSGCGLRYAATEAQQENAFLHARVCSAAAQTAVDEDASARLCDLTALAQKQSEAFVVDYGSPSRYPLPASPCSPLSEGEYKGDTLDEMNELADAARADAARRPDAWDVADGAIELGIALAGLLGGVYGARAAGLLRQARQKSKALKEIVAGNELFKQLYPEQAERFKEAQAKQSASTRQLVTELK